MEATALRLSGDFSVEALAFDTITVPAPAAGEVLVRVRAASLNSRDLMIVQGTYNPRVQKSRILGSDAAGEIVSVGEGVTEFRPGDRVIASFMLAWADGPATLAARQSAMGDAVDGVFTTYRTLPASALVPLPDGYSFEEGATFPCAGVTAWHALVSTGAIGPTDTVLVLGTGGVSVFAIQIAHMRGARVIVTSSSDEKIAQAKQIGADEGINYRTTPDWDKAVRALTGKAGATHIVETGGAGTLPLSLRASAIGAQISVIGVLSGAEQPVNVVPILMNTLRVQGIYVGSTAMLRDVTSAYAETKVRPVIDRVFPFAEAKEALRYLESGQHFGKIVLSMED